jgi:hypothetical protein
VSLPALIDVFRAAGLTRSLLHGFGHRRRTEKFRNLDGICKTCLSG